MFAVFCVIDYHVGLIFSRRCADSLPYCVNTSTKVCIQLSCKVSHHKYIDITENIRVISKIACIELKTGRLKIRSVAGTHAF